jgi:hypothetical protein
MLAPDWLDQHIITLGYGGGELRATIAADYLRGIRLLISPNRLNRNSANPGSPMRLVVTQRPQSRTEVELFNALNLSLHITAQSQ